MFRYTVRGVAGRGVGGGQWCDDTRRQSPKDGKINFYKYKMIFFPVLMFLIYWAPGKEI
jgi:hypothetical protein